MFLAFSGFAQSGKDTAGQYLVDTYGFNRHAFADKLREIAWEANPTIIYPNSQTHTGYSKRNLSEAIEAYGYEVAKQNPDVREFYQNLGLGARKIFGTNFWIEQLWRELDTKYGFYTKDLGVRTPQANVVITDVRFENEAQAIHDAGGIVIRLVRGQAVNEHISEKPLPPNLIDYEIDNTGTLEDLYGYLNDILAKEEFIGIK